MLPPVPAPQPRSTFGRLRAILVLLAASAAPLLCPAASPALAKSPSSFLRASAGSPVDWQLWEPAVLARAKAGGKPVYVFVGAFLSELSRATCRQTFANPDTAAFLNKNFLCVIVDREAQPDVAALVADYLRNVKQVTTWPAHLWLTPDLQPFEGTGYLPPTEEWGKASFMKFATQTLNAWATDAAGCRSRATDAVASLLAPAGAPAAAPADLKTSLTAAADAWRALFDATHAGFGDPPKKPEPELLRFLLARSAEDRAMALATLRALAASTVRDPLDGGFFRYAVDAAWHLPSQQKTLADQARLALAFQEAAQGDDAKSFTAAARGALDYALTRLANPDGTFAAAVDATAEEFSGYYAWTEQEIDAALGKDSPAFESAFGVVTAGNVSADDDISGRLKGKNLLRNAGPVDAGLAAAAARLLAERDKRPAPPKDEHATAAAHGLLLTALARVGAAPDGARYLEAAGRTFDAVKKHFLIASTGGLRHLAGADTAATAQDYAAVALGCRELARAAHRADAGALADELLAKAGATYFSAKQGRYFATPAELPAGFFARPLAVDDAPSAESLALLAGVPKEQGAAMVAALAAGWDEAATPPAGDTLLALALFPSN